MPLDVLPGSAGLAVAADAAAGEDGGFAGVSEAELVGVLCAWDRVEAHAAEFTADQVAYVLGESRGRAESLVDLARTLQTRLPGTAAALDDGTVSRYKAEIIARATALLDDAGARAAEDKILDRAARLTPGGLRAAIAHAVMEVAPKKAKERREAAARDARVERWIEDSGNAALMGCELPPDEGPGRRPAESLATDPCDHRHETRGHDPGVKLRHLSQVRHATCTSPVCRRPATQCDHEHNIPYEAGGRSCLCNTGPQCKR
jgi:hypothetical protein